MSGGQVQEVLFYTVQAELAEPAAGEKLSQGMQLVNRFIISFFFLPELLRQVQMFMIFNFKKKSKCL